MEARYELHTEGNIYLGSFEELKDLTNSLSAEWEIYAFVPSAINKIRVSHNSRLTILECKNIIKLRRNGWAVGNIGLKYHIDPDTVKKILNSDYKTQITI